jgi:hypothetical protein
MLLKFQNGNKKLNSKIFTFSLPAGWACPFAHNCLSKTNPETGKLTDGEFTEFRCFAAMAEATYPTVRKARWYNFDLLKPLMNNIDSMVDLIQKSIPSKATIIRIHVSGDFFNQNYFDAWLKVAANNPNVLFYAYTKSIPYWINRLTSINNTTNFKLTASIGGKHDDLVQTNNLKYAQVVYSKEEAKELNLLIDTDDSLAYSQNNSFALLIHGVQPKGSKASIALSNIKKQKNK